MLQLKDITKSYKTGDFTQVALNKVSLNFRESEFVAILGQSGSGKTTLLNVIGGLDQYDSGELIINGQSTKHFQDGEWDAYRNNSVGFIFQSYNLISHLSIVDNVEMGMTLSGVSTSEKNRKAIEVLEKVGLKDHIHKKPNQLSGGQMQRVAIARALANNPDIILADEPTGALDSETSEQIMELIKTIAEDKLVIMVTHNPELAEQYADRVIKFSDGSSVSDTNPLATQKATSNYTLKKTSMNFLTALKLSGKNIATKKWRTGLTAFASSIGIIGIALILSLSNGFDKQISTYETGAMSNFPITISQSAMSVDVSDHAAMGGTDLPMYPTEKTLIPYDPTENSIIHTNVLTTEYLDYLDKIDPELMDGISYTRTVNLNMLKSDGEIASTVNKGNVSFSTYPSKQEDTSGSYLEQYYDVLEGSFPTKETDLVLIVDQYNRMNNAALDALGINYNVDSINLADLVGYELKLIKNDDFYKKNGEQFTVNGTASNLMDMYNNDEAITLNIVGVIREQEDSKMSTLPAGIAYSDELATHFIEDAKTSEIVKAQQEADYNVLTGQILSDDIAGSGMAGMTQAGMPSMDPSMAAAMAAAMPTTSTKEAILASLGATEIPTSVSLYPLDFGTKESITTYLDEWNTDLAEEDQVLYTDLAAIVTSISGGIMDGITMVLVAFAAISLVVSLIMISIITYISVMERTKEIGVLRALGARKKDITRVFNAETFIIGVCSGVLGIGITYLLTIPVNAILFNLTELSNVAQLNPIHAITLGIISVVLTMLGGFIPAKMAAKKDPVTALRSE
ncbi:ATP-binding cassette domain-containing protein [Paenibacillus crassostreae]|uniref:Sulfate ABC transporter ATP-binding protein n=1 Tax=Paenibacillus crassostreae TaxID=1763538 RepID=A0A167FJQ4_9BACL|nr:ABC transporter ATP-binding protein/permease [Paenibacillus crassostreae]AOZ94332.1 sulfate ABC transporter ATP-binding protein [Paenibacillus crassostreae]OAB76630.1 sulfate ABC transporter ATP-binding protein [Paenibacillus crassostreae]